MFEAYKKIKEYAAGVGMGVRNFHFFRMSLFPRLLRSLSARERRVIAGALAVFLIASSLSVYITYYQATIRTASYGGGYIEGIVGQPRFINPILASANTVDSDIARIVFSGLYRLDSQERLTPELAAALPEISSDQKQYTVRLRDSAVWHDGTKVTADDVVFTIKLIQNPSYQSPLRLTWAKVDVHKTDDQTVVFTLKEASAPFAANLTQGLLPKHIWESVEPIKFSLSKYNTQPIGSGPYELRDINRSDDGEYRSIKFAAFGDYIHGRPYIDEVEMKFYLTYNDLINAYHSRAIQGLGYVPFDKKIYVEKSSGINLYRFSLPQYLALFFNRAKSPVLADKSVRTALARSVDRNQIIKEVYMDAATPAYGPIPPGYTGFSSSLEGMLPYDAAAAAELLDTAGWIMPPGSDTRAKGKQNLEFTIVTSNFPLNIKTAELLQQQWKKVGVKIDLQILAIGELEQNYLRPREYEALLFSENIGADPDPFSFWHSSQRADPGLNLSLFSSKDADQLILEGRSNNDPAYRSQRYQKLQELLVSDVPAVFIADAQYVYAITSKVHGISEHMIADQSERFSDIASWYVKTKRIKKTQ